MGLLSKLPFMGSSYPSKSLVYRNRAGGEPVAEETAAKRLQYDDLPDIHELQTGEETKAAELRGITQVYESDKPIYYIEHDGQILLFRGVVDSLDTIDTASGTPLIHFYEAEAGQLINFVPRFGDDDITGDYHQQVKAIWEQYEEDSDQEEPDVPKEDDIGLENYLIDDKDERITAVIDHALRKEEKYKKGGWRDIIAESGLLFGAGMGVALLFAIFFHYWGDIIPVLQDIAQNLPELIEAVKQLNEGDTATPPGG